MRYIKLGAKRRCISVRDTSIPRMNRLLFTFHTTTDCEKCFDILCTISSNEVSLMRPEQYEQSLQRLAWCRFEGSIKKMRRAYTPVSKRNAQRIQKIPSEGKNTPFGT